MLYATLATSLAMIAFAANSVLARLAPGDDAIDPASYTGVRIVSGALVLALIAVLRRVRAGKDAGLTTTGDWPSAVALFAYAAAFSYAYLSLGAATGALILFAAVQLTMILWGIVRGERPGPQALAGLLLAFAGFVWMLLPGLRAPDPGGSALMILSGIAWGIYSLRGRGAGDPLAETAGNFLRAAPLCLPLFLLPGVLHATAPGLWLAVLSGAVASGLGYAVWYTALPLLGRMQAATVQLTVPVIAAAGAVVFLSEDLTARLVVSAAVILAGVLIVIRVKARTTS